MNVIDLRSDTVTRPTPQMREAIALAEVGDDVYGDDPTVNVLQEKVAALCDKEVALFVTSGTQGNLCALISHCQRGDEALVGELAHLYRYEAGGGAVLGSIQPQPLQQQADGTLALSDIEAAIKTDDPHLARTVLLCLENTSAGKILPQVYVQAATALAHGRGLATHLDGVRLFNAAVATGLAPAELVRGFDTVSLCFSKGRGAPVGSALVGSSALISRARRVRKMFGGGLRQAGLLAAAALYALDHHVERLAVDHANALRLAEGLMTIPGVSVSPPQTNIVFADVEGGRADELVLHLKSRGVLVNASYNLRFVTHLDVDAAGVDRAVSAVSEFMSAGESKMPITNLEALTRTIDHREIFHDEMLALMRRIMGGEMSPVMTAALLVGLRVKKETIGEITAAAQVMREFSTKVEVKDRQHLVDIVGTGGDGSHTFNISTCSMFVAAACGARVSKHGNRSVSSKSGSADVLEALGVILTLPPAKIAQCIADTGIGFMFAPNHHPAMKNVAPVRKELGVRTIFNILGPLTNPADAPNILMGVFHPDLVGIQVRALQRLGAEHAVVVYGRDGMDEVSLGAATMVGEYKDEAIREYEIHPEDFGLTMASNRTLKVETPEQSKTLLRSVLENEPGPARDIVILNAGVGLYAANVAATMADGIVLAREALASGKALARMHQFVERTKELAAG